MSAGRDFLLFFGFLVVLGIIWFLTGGPSRTISHAGWFLNPPAPLGNGSGYNIPGVDMHSGNTSPVGYTSQQQGQQTGGNTPSLWDYFFNYRPGLGESAPPPTSPYAQYVRFSAGQTNTSNPNSEYVVIQTSSNLQSNITITGWSLISGISGIQVPIGNAAAIPFLGQANIESPISVGPNSTIILVSGRSPNGTSFRLNKCTGYFSQFQRFTPSLPQECPQPQDELAHFPGIFAGNDNCLNFVQGIPQCTLIVTEIPGNVGAACQNFILNTLSYSGCLTAHRNDYDFYRNEWLVYLNRDQELWQNSHDAIRLLDENGKLVGQIGY